MLRPAVIFTSLCLLTACASSSNWKLQQMQASEAQFRSARLCSKTNDFFHGLEFELLQLGGKLRGYINVFSQSVPHKKNEEFTSVTLSIGEERHYDTARILQGGQRILLNDSLTNLIIASLSQGKEVRITLSGYEGALNPEHFLPKYKKLLSLSTK